MRHQALAAHELLIDVQHQLFNLGGELSIPGFELLKAEAVLALDAALETGSAGVDAVSSAVLQRADRELERRTGDVDVAIFDVNRVDAQLVGNEIDGVQTVFDLAYDGLVYLKRNGKENYLEIFIFH